MTMPFSNVCPFPVSQPESRNSQLTFWCTGGSQACGWGAVGATAPSPVRMEGLRGPGQLLVTAGEGGRTQRQVCSPPFSSSSLPAQEPGAILPPQCPPCPPDCTTKGTCEQLTQSTCDRLTGAAWSAVKGLDLHGWVTERVLGLVPRLREGEDLGRGAFLEEVNAEWMENVQAGVQRLSLGRGVSLRVQDVSGLGTQSGVSKGPLGKSTTWDEAMLMLLHY